MTTTAPEAPARPPVPEAVPATPAQLAWLTDEVAAWSREGLLTPEASAAVLARYRAVRRVSVGRLLLLIGTAFAGVGAIWLVGANLHHLPPLGRLGVVASAWLGLLLGAEALATRAPAPAVLAMRTLSAILVGAVVLQASQSLQVPAWEPSLLGWWGLGALVHAYAVRSRGPLLVGVLTSTTWYLWAALESSPTGLDLTLAPLLVALVASGLAAVHTRWLPSFASTWRTLGVALALAGLFTGALPFVTTEGFEGSRWIVVGGAVAALAGLAGLALAEDPHRLEPLGTALVVGVAVLLVAWETDPDPLAVVGGADVAHALVAVAAYAVAAVGAAVLGTLRDSWPVTAVATAAIVVFTTFQSFAVFARIVDGAWLFLLLGLVLAGTGLAFDRARRGLARTLAPGAGR